MPTVSVELGRRRYPVIIGPDVLSRSVARLARIGHESRCFLLYDANVFALYGKIVRRSVKQSGFGCEEFVLPAGEGAKTSRVVNSIHSFLLDQQISRSDLIVACGGGVAGDVAGYAAATVLRGVRWAIISTTLLGMVDAAIGGKTGINHARGKNLIGAFWQPSLVACDTTFLQTLPSRQFVAGLGEVLKYSGLMGDPMSTTLDRTLDRPDQRDHRSLTSLIRHSVQYKAGVVERDERERGHRMVLNFGHTFAHAIEHAAGYGRLLHGEAVTIGLLVAVELSCRLKRSRAKRLQPYRRQIIQMMRLLPHREIDVRSVLSAMALDKKRSGRTLRFVVLDRPGRPLLGQGVPTRQVAASIQAALDVYQSEGGTHAPHSRR